MSNPFTSWFGAKTTSESTTTLLAPYALTVSERLFINIKTQNLYERILKKCYHKTNNYKTDENISFSVFFNSEEGSQSNGTIPLVAKAMTEKRKIYLVYDSKIGLTKEASNDEKEIIDAQYAKTNNVVSNLQANQYGVKLDFTKFAMTDLVKCYSGMIYSIMKSANTQIKLSESLQIKISKLRENISTMTSEDAEKQASNINESLKNGYSVLLDQADEIIQTVINSESVEKALDMVNTLLASEIGLSFSFVSGKLTSGMSATGDADINYEDIGIKDYWVSIWKPICVKLYDSKNVTYKSDRWRSLESKMRTLTYIENSSLISDEDKQEIVKEMLDKE